MVASLLKYLWDSNHILGTRPKLPDGYAQFTKSFTRGYPSQWCRLPQTTSLHRGTFQSSTRLHATSFPTFGTSFHLSILPDPPHLPITFLRPHLPSHLPSGICAPRWIHPMAPPHMDLQSSAATLVQSTHSTMPNTPYVQLCDNDPATHAINKGSGKHQPLNNLIGSHWAWHNRHQLTQILKRVPSKANIADPFSRRDFTIAESLGWNIFQAPTEHLIPTVHKIVGNATFAHQQGLSQNDAIHQFRRNLWYHRTKTADTKRATLCVNHMSWVVATTGKNRRRGLVLTQILWRSHTQIEPFTDHRNKEWKDPSRSEDSLRDTEPLKTRFKQHFAAVQTPKPHSGIEKEKEKARLLCTLAMLCLHSDWTIWLLWSTKNLCAVTIYKWKSKSHENSDIVRMNTLNLIRSHFGSFIAQIFVTHPPLPHNTHALSSPPSPLLLFHCCTAKSSFLSGG